MRQVKSFPIITIKVMRVIIRFSGQHQHGSKQEKSLNPAFEMAVK
jgi:hypothetical protein